MPGNLCRVAMTTGSLGRGCERMEEAWVFCTLLCKPDTRFPPSRVTPSLTQCLTSPKRRKSVLRKFLCYELFSGHDFCVCLPEDSYYVEECQSPISINYRQLNHLMGLNSAPFFFFFCILYYSNSNSKYFIVRYVRLSLLVSLMKGFGLMCLILCFLMVLWKTLEDLGLKSFHSSHCLVVL